MTATVQDQVTPKRSLGTITEPPGPRPEITTMPASIPRPVASAPQRSRSSRRTASSIPPQAIAPSSRPTQGSPQTEVACVTVVARPNTPPTTNRAMEPASGVPRHAPC